MEDNSPHLEFNIVNPECRTMLNGIYWEIIFTNRLQCRDGLSYIWAKTNYQIQQLGNSKRFWKHVA